MDSKLAIKQLKALGKMTEGLDIRLAAEWSEDWKVLIATMMSAQSRDTKTIEIAERLFEKFPTPEKLERARLSSIEKEIRSLNYYRTKARHIKETCKMIVKNGIGETVEDLILFPGVGRKTANVYLAEAKSKAAIGVDTHLSYTSQYLGWSRNKNPYKIEEDLSRLFPKSYHRSINYIVVRFGQTFRSKKEKDGILDRISKIR